MPGPLAAMTVVEFGGIGPGPFAGMVLADMGATVIRIDRPGAELTPAMSVMCRGKKSLALDLKQRDAVDVVRRLVCAADASIEGFRPGVMERLGMGSDACLAWNPRLVYGRMTGWGQTGPYQQAVGHDINYIALNGVLHSMPGADGTPAFPMNLVGDFGGGGLILAFGIACALLEVGHSGRGQVIDAAMVDGANLLTASLHGALAAGRWRHAPGGNYLDGGCHFYNVYRTADGQYLAVGAIEAQFYLRLLELLDLAVPVDEQWNEDLWPEMKRRFADVFATRTRDDWIAHFGDDEVCVTPVLSLEEARADQHLVDRQTVIDVDGIAQPAPAPRFSRTPASVRHGAPGIGADTREVLDSLNYSAAEIDTLLSAATA